MTDHEMSDVVLDMWAQGKTIRDIEKWCADNYCAKSPSSLYRYIIAGRKRKDPRAMRRTNAVYGE